METKSPGLSEQKSSFSSPVRDETSRDFFRDEIPLMDKAETDAQKALQERPSFSIRARLSLGFFLFFILSFGVTVAALVIISKIENKLTFMEAVSTYTFEIQQARRFEKNFFLYRTNLNDALDNVQKAQESLLGNGAKIKSVVGIKNYDIMFTHVERYKELLTRLLSLKRETDNVPQGLEAIETELRTHGGEMVSVAHELNNPINNIW
jgi:two-component system NtrC family sensor kinase